MALVYGSAKVVDKQKGVKGKYYLPLFNDQDKSHKQENTNFKSVILNDIQIMNNERQVFKIS